MAESSNEPKPDAKGAKKGGKASKKKFERTRFCHHRGIYISRLAESPPVS